MEFCTKPLSAELWGDLEAYFEFNGKCSGCWCMNHRLPMGLDFEGEAAKLAMKQLVLSTRVFGVLAYIDGDAVPVGWASLDRKQTLPGHDCIGKKIECSSDEWSVHCITSREDCKNIGVERVLLESAVALAKKLGGVRVEGYPEPGSKEEKAFSTWNTFNGYEDSFKALGFTKVDGDFGEASEFYSPMEVSVK